jgi:fumarate hydratase class II
MSGSDRLLRRPTLRWQGELPHHRRPHVAGAEFVKAFGYVKKAAALANRDLGVLDRESPTRSPAPATG